MGLVVQTKYGKVEGFEAGGVNKWFGIPYAKPPIGELRFKRPQECSKWDGVRPAKAFSNRPIQFNKLLGMATNLPQSEDCLYANVWTPKDADKCPVFVWIYGGANCSGEGSDPTYFGESFAQKGVVFVNYNYRLGPLGFYDFSSFDKSFDSNCGFADQLAGVRWVKENIAAFGGDPDNITICGESAGGTAVYDLLACPSAQGLFNKAIAQSGLAGSTVFPQSQRLNVELFLQKMKMKPENVHLLKTVNPLKMKSAADWVFKHNCSIYPGIFAPGPMVDDLLPWQPWEAIEKGVSKGVDVIFGTCHDEGTLFVALKAFPWSWSLVENMLSFNHSPEKLPLLKELYYGRTEKQAMQELARDRAFWADYVKCADAQQNHSKVWAYRYDFVTTLMKISGMGAMHATDIGIALDTHKGNYNKGFQFTPKHRLQRIRGYMHGAWVNFVKYGDPNGSLPLKWDTYDDKERTTYIFNDKCSIEKNPNARNFEVWKDIALYQ